MLAPRAARLVRQLLLLPAVGCGGAAAGLAGAAAHSTTSSAQRGLFGLQRLQAASDFPRWAAEAKARCDELVAQVLAAAPDASVVALVDEISDTICQVYDSAECCRNIHPDASWQQAATQTCESLSEYLANINHHEGLYRKLVDVQAAHAASVAAAAAAPPPPPAAAAAAAAGAGARPSPAPAAAAAAGSREVALLSPQQLSAFCPETLVVARRYAHDFEKFGIHLQGAQQRAQAARLLAQHQHFPALFNAALADPKQLGTVAVPSHLVPHSWGFSSRLTGRVSVPLASGSIHAFLAATESEEARRQVYLAGASSPRANLVLLDHILSTRHELARLLGFDSYAAFKAADDTLAGAPAAAEGFLLDLTQGCRQQADAEVAALTRLKRAHTSDAGAVLQPWDQEFYSRQLAGASPHMQAAAAAAPYLQLASVLSGVDALLHQLMGLRLQLQPLARGEGWAPGVLKLAVSCEQQGPLGTLYLDLLARPGKPAASGILYPLRCGRALRGGAYQQPVLCLVGNLSASTGSSKDPSGMLLTWREFRTLLHEFGHAVHSLVSRTRYQHVWGTRCAQDFVEVPSHLFEHFCSHRSSLALLARHVGTREPLPEKLAAQLSAGGASSANAVTPGLELQQQGLLSLIDLMYHGHELPSDTTAMWHTLADRHLSLPPPPQTSPQARFSHLTIYGACYYSYLYARCISGALWVHCLAADPLNPTAGRLIRKQLLEPGGAEIPLTLLSNTLGSSAPEVMVRHHGGWSPSPAPLLAGIAAGNGRGR